MRIKISRDSDVPIKEQLAAQIVFLIGTGQLKPGDSLPSVRELALRLKVHRNTVSQAYSDPKVKALVQKDHGRRLTVRGAHTTESSASPDLDDVITHAVDAARKLGYTLQQVHERVQERLRTRPPDHLLIISNDPGMRVLLQLEMQQRFSVPVGSCTAAELKSNRDRANGALVVSSPAALPEVQSVLPAASSPIQIRYQTAETILEQVRQLQPPALVAVASISQYFLEMARDVLAPALGQGITLREYLLTPDNQSLPRSADVILCDSVAYSVLKQQDSKSRIVVQRVVSPAWADEVERLMAES